MCVSANKYVRHKDKVINGDIRSMSIDSVCWLLSTGVSPPLSQTDGEVL